MLDRLCDVTVSKLHLFCKKFSKRKRIENVQCIPVPTLFIHTKVVCMHHRWP